MDKQQQRPRGRISFPAFLPTRPSQPRAVQYPQPNMTMPPEHSSFQPYYPDPEQQRLSNLPYHQPPQIAKVHETMTQPAPPPPPQHRAHVPIAEAQPPYANVDIASFMRWKDSHLASLYAIETGAQQLRFKFITDSETLLRGGHISTQDVVNLQHNYGHFQNQALPQAPPPPNVAPAAHAPAAKPEKKPKRPHDKNAPTKAMTPFFLYMQTERPKIQKELGPQYKPKEVEAIGQQRWKSITPEEKQAVKYQYFCNRAGYYKQNELYREHGSFPEFTQAEKEKFYAEELEKEHRDKIRGPGGGVPTPAPQTVAARAKSHEPATETETTSDDDDDEEDSESEDDDDTPAPAKKEPTPPPSKKRKTVPAETPATATKFPSKLKSVSQPEAVEESPVRQKRKRDKKEAAAAVAAPPAVTPSSPVVIAIPGSQAGGEKKRKRKLRKSEATEAD